MFDGLNMYQELFELQERIFKVMANRKRLEVLRLLATEELSVADMEKCLIFGRQIFRRGRRPETHGARNVTHLVNQ